MLSFFPSPDDVEDTPGESVKVAADDCWRNPNNNCFCYYFFFTDKYRLKKPEYLRCCHESLRAVRRLISSFKARYFSLYLSLSALNLSLSSWIARMFVAKASTWSSDSEVSKTYIAADKIFF